MNKTAIVLLAGMLIAAPAVAEEVSVNAGDYDINVGDDISVTGLNELNIRVGADGSVAVQGAGADVIVDGDRVSVGSMEVGADEVGEAVVDGDIIDHNLSDRDLHDQRFINVDIVRTSFKNSDLTNVEFTNVTCTNCDFTGAKFANTRFTNFECVSCLGLSFSNSGAEFINADFD